MSDMRLEWQLEERAVPDGLRCTAENRLEYAVPKLSATLEVSCKVQISSSKRITRTSKLEQA